jgi:hypothetical protein
MTNDSYLPAEYNTGIVRGDFFEETFSFTISGEPINLESSTVRIQLRNSITSGGEVVGEYTIGNGISIRDNLIAWVIDDQETVTLIPGVYNYDVEVTTSNKKRTYIRGKFSVVQDITY